MLEGEEVSSVTLCSVPWLSLYSHRFRVLRAACCALSAACCVLLVFSSCCSSGVRAAQGERKCVLTLKYPDIIPVGRYYNQDPCTEFLKYSAPLIKASSFSTRQPVLRRRDAARRVHHPREGVRALCCCHRCCPAAADVLCHPCAGSLAASSVLTPGCCVRTKVRQQPGAGGGGHRLPQADRLPARIPVVGGT